MFLSETTLSQKFKTTLEAKNDQQILSALLSPIPIKLSAEAVAAFFASLAFNLHCARAPGIQGAEVYMRLTSFVWTNPAVLLLDPSRIHFWKLLCFISLISILKAPLLVVGLPPNTNPKSNLILQLVQILIIVSRTRQKGGPLCS